MRRIWETVYAILKPVEKFRKPTVLARQREGGCARAYPKNDPSRLYYLVSQMLLLIPSSIGTSFRPVRARKHRGIALPLQGGLLEEDYVSQGVALG